VLYLVESEVDLIATNQSVLCVISAI